MFNFPSNAHYLYRPDLINFEQLKSTQPLANLNNAFDVAERELDAEGKFH